MLPSATVIGELWPCLWLTPQPRKNSSAQTGKIEHAYRGEPKMFVYCLILTILSYH
jgi:hypothetical protein